MSKKLVLTLVLIMLVTMGVSPVMGAREGTWELTTTIPNLPLACGVYIHPSGDFVIVSERAGLLVQMSPVDYSVLKTLQLPVATDGDSLCWATPLVDHSLIYYPDEHGDIFVVDPVELTIQQVIDTAGPYRLVITQDGSTAIDSHPMPSYPGLLNFYDLTQDPVQFQQVAVDGQPGGLALSPDDKYVYFANCCGGVRPQIHKLDVQTRTEVGMVDFTGLFEAITSSLATDPVNRKIFGATDTGLVVVDMDDLTYEFYPIGTISRVTYDSINHIMVATGVNELLILNPDTYEVNQRVPLGGTTLCVPSFSIDGSKVFVGDVPNGVVYVVEYQYEHQPPSDRPGGPPAGHGPK